MVVLLNGAKVSNVSVILIDIEKYYLLVMEKKHFPEKSFLDHVSNTDAMK